jgi:hypothetical protein
VREKRGRERGERKRKRERERCVEKEPDCVAVERQGSG